MRAAVMRDQKLVVDTLPDPEPGPGEVLVKTLACGICGSDLHALKYAARLAESSREAGGSFTMDPRRDVVMGHEFCAEIADFGPKTERTLRVGDRVCSMPLVLRSGRASSVGYSNEFPGGYGEYMLLSEPLLLPGPDGLLTEHAALTEPMAVGLHAVRKSGLSPGDVPLVVGCGPVGLAVIAALRLEGAEPIVAADFSRRRRDLAVALGAHVVVDPAKSSPYESWAEAARSEASAPDGGLFGAGPRLRPAVMFECVGVPGVIQQMMSGAPRGARVVVVGVCMEEDRIQPLHAINKELALQFVLGYTAEEFAETLRNIAEGASRGEALITGSVGVEGVVGAFEELASPERHAKILVEPWRS